MPQTTHAVPGAVDNTLRNAIKTAAHRALEGMLGKMQYHAGGTCSACAMRTLVVWCVCWGAGAALQLVWLAERWGRTEVIQSGSLLNQSKLFAVEYK
jgi:hypothetical protein